MPGVDVPIADHNVISKLIIILLFLNDRAITLQQSQIYCVNTWKTKNHLPSPHCFQMSPLSFKFIGVSLILEGVEVYFGTSHLIAKVY